MNEDFAGSEARPGRSPLFVHLPMEVREPYGVGVEYVDELHELVLQGAKAWFGRGEVGGDRVHVLQRFGEPRGETLVGVEAFAELGVVEAAAVARLALRVDHDAADAKFDYVRVWQSN